MRNKYTFLITTLVHLSFMVTACCQQTMNDFCCPEPYIESPLFEYHDAAHDEETHDAYRYISLGVGPVIFIPNAGLGYRQRYSKFGWDTALSFSTIGYAHQLNAHLVGHYYLSPLQKNSTYLGLGLIGSGVFTNRGKGGGTLSSDFVMGRELERKGNHKHFIEMHVAIPTMWIQSKSAQSMHFPLMYIKYGVNF